MSNRTYREDRLTISNPSEEYDERREDFRAVCKSRAKLRKDKEARRNEWLNLKG